MVTGVWLFSIVYCINIAGKCPECLSGSAKVNISKEGGWVPSNTDSDFLDGTIEPTTENTTVAAAVSITIAVIVAVLAILVVVFAIWLLHGMYCRKRLMRISMV